MEKLIESKPCASFKFEVEKIIGVSSDGNYQVQWAPAWVSKFHLVGCEHLIQEFLEEQAQCGIEVEAENGLHLPYVQGETNRRDEFEQHLQQQSEVVVKAEPEMQLELQYLSNEMAVNSHMHDIVEQSQLESKHQYEVLPHGSTEEEEEEGPYGNLQTNITMELQESNDQTTLEHSKNGIEIAEDPNLEADLPKTNHQYSNQQQDDNELFHLGDPKPLQYICRICHKELSSGLDLETHEALHISDVEAPGSQYGEKLFKCSHCKKSFRRSCHLNKHLKTHTGSKSYSCQQCSYSCAQKLSFDEHMDTHRAVKPSHTYSCSHCGKKFRKKSALMLHVRTHTGKKPFSCDQCSYSCVQHSSLTVHLRTHTGEKPFPCNQCDYSSRSKGHLARHMRTHTGERPHACDHCTFSSVSKSNLKRHLRTHTGEKQHVCAFCARSFGRKENLKKHMQTHTGDKNDG